jgi:5-methylcytosine-specific restriction endonuclease McrA
MVNHKDANQLLYVAMSRAKKEIIFIDKESNFRNDSNRYSFSEFEKNAIASSQDFKCKICELEVNDREFDIDHKIPIANNGRNTIDNLQAICRPCHKKKTAKETYFNKLKKQ